MHRFSKNPLFPNLQVLLWPSCFTVWANDNDHDVLRLLCASTALSCVVFHIPLPCIEDTIAVVSNARPDLSHIRVRGSVDGQAVKALAKFRNLRSMELHLEAEPSVLHDLGGLRHLESLKVTWRRHLLEPPVRPFRNGFPALRRLQLSLAPNSPIALSIFSSITSAVLTSLSLAITDPTVPEALDYLRNLFSLSTLREIGRAHV